MPPRMPATPLAVALICNSRDNLGSLISHSCGTRESFLIRGSAGFQVTFSYGSSNPAMSFWHARPRIARQSIARWHNNADSYAGNCLRSRFTGDTKTAMFPPLAGKGTGGKFGLSGRFAVIMKKARIEGKISQPRRADAHCRIFHSTYCATASTQRWRMPGVSQEIRQKLTGHAKTLHASRT